MHKDTKFCYSSFDISTFGFKAPPYCAVEDLEQPDNWQSAAEFWAECEWLRRPHITRRPSVLIPVFCPQ